MVGLIGKKIGMTQIYNEKQELVPVTVVEAGPCPVAQVRTSEQNGYSALQLAYDQIPPRKATKPQAGFFKKIGFEPHRLLREFRLEVDGDFEVGQVLDVGQFEVGEQVQVRGRSKGKGFAGVVKRHHFHGKNTTHGTPDRVRHAGAIGQGTTPGKVWKGKKMSGQMGNTAVAVKNLYVVRVDAERNLLFLKGAVPGATNGYITIRKS